MIRSMTGFGRGEARDEVREVIVEIKTVNHRYLDVFVRMPKQISFLEEKLRDAVSKTLSRGKIEIFVSFKDLSEESNNVFIDEGLAGAYIKALEKLKEKFGLKDDISVSLISKFPDVVIAEKVRTDEEKIWQLVKRSLDEALNGVMKMREYEGQQIRKSLLEKVNLVNDVIREIAAISPTVVIEYKQKLESRIKEWAGQQPLDENRLAMEVAMFADRCSIDEELVRLESHVNQFKGTLDEDYPVGRKLDFLIQEINREVNTIGSKSNNLLITKNVVELKSEIEKMREQVQNIE